MCKTEQMTIGSFIVSTIILIVVAYRSPEHLGEIYWVYCLTFAGLTVTKGVVDTMQMKTKIKGDNREQN